MYVTLLIAWVVLLYLSTATLPVFHQAESALADYPLLSVLLPNPILELVWQFGLPTVLVAAGWRSTAEA